MDEMTLPWSLMCRLACRSLITGHPLDRMLHDVRMQYMMAQMQKDMVAAQATQPKLKRGERREQQRRVANGRS